MSLTKSRKSNNLSLIGTNKSEQPNFQSKTDIEKISATKKSGKGSTDVVGFRLEIQEEECHKIPESAQNSLQWNQIGVFTKNKDLAIFLIQMHGAILID